MEVTWEVEFHPDFDPEFDALPEAVQDSIRTYAFLLQQLGPFMARPYVGTLHGSRFTNMKELRFDTPGGWGQIWGIAGSLLPSTDS